MRFLICFKRKKKNTTWLAKITSRLLFRENTFSIQSESVVACSSYSSSASVASSVQMIILRRSQRLTASHRVHLGRDEMRWRDGQQQQQVIIIRAATKRGSYDV